VADRSSFVREGLRGRRAACGPGLFGVVAWPVVDSRPRRRQRRAHSAGWSWG